MKTALEALFQAMISDGWACESAGMVDAPTGYFSWLEIKATDVRRIGEDFSDVLDTYGHPQSDEIVGFFLVVEDSQGFVNITRTDSEKSALAAYTRLEAEFLDWEDTTPLP